MIQNPVNTFPPVIIELNGVIVPPLKSSKQLIRSARNGKPMLITKPETKRRLNEITESIALKLLLACQTASGETLTGSSLRSWIASSLPEDDCWTQIPEITIKGELCKPGEERVTIKITRLHCDD